ncbi:YceI family protein [Novosphingobium beihaiensis]|uniref:YceI family protein n=1 Tax=Novosphingobium beihaiensis TaxID=2930389 RepID=A0ABT0BMC5_9SPHN|nr:YceI family protein [Novosphingobium beihaiensis]MCJ2185864.1 YceI family protein [Novosphingobium beihaiensis]
MTSTRYARSAIALHWAIAFLLLFQLGLGWHMTSMGKGAAMYAAFQFHKSIGITVLALSVLRVAIRFVKPRPAPVESGVLTGLLMKLVHLGLYAFMIGGPLTGWIVVSTAKVAIPTRLFGVIPWPHLPVSHALNGIAMESHEVLAWMGLGLVALHLAGAVRHHLGGGHENVIGRMIPAVSAPEAARRAIPAALGAAGLLGAAFLSPWLLYRAAPAAPEAPASDTPVAGGSDPAAASSEAVEGPVQAETSEPGEAQTDAPASSEVAVPVAPTSTPAPEASATEAAKPVSWKVMDGGRLGFTASMSGTAIEGRFDQWSADILFDPDALAQSKITVRVPLLSVNTADGSRDSMLKGADFFGSAGTAVFRSSRIRHLGGERYTASGTLSMNGVSRPVTLAFTLHIEGARADVTGSTKLDRTAFGIGQGQWASTDQIAANVDVTFQFSARKAP